MNARSIAILLKELFSKVYYNVLTLEKGKKSRPMYWNKDRYEYVGINQSKIDIAYVREFQDAAAVPIDIGGCSPLYDLKYFYRIVYYISTPGCGANKEYYKQRLLDLLSDKNIQVKRVITDSNRLLRMEQSTDITLMGDVVYQAIDIEVIENNSEVCPEDINPCKTENCCIC